MSSLSISSLIIPGYETLSAEIRAVFEASVSGGKFTRLVRSNIESAQKSESPPRFWWRIIGLSEGKQQDFQDQFLVQKQELLDDISETEEYKTIIMHSTHQMLAKEIGYYKFLTKEQQELLSRAEFSQKLLNAVTSLDQLIEKEKQVVAKQGLWLNLSISNFFKTASFPDDSINELLSQRNDVINLWKAQFQEHPYMEYMRQTIKENMELLRKEEMARKLTLLQERATQLGTFFPLLNYRKVTTDKPVIEQLQAQYLSANGEVTTEPDNVEEEKLTDLLFHCMQQVSQIEINFVNLDDFNQKMANQLAIKVLHAFNDESELDLDKWFKSYKQHLLQHMTKQLQLIKGKDWELKNSGLKEELYSSLSYLWNNKAVNKANEFMRKMADAHGFIQATSFSTQNESSFLAILDMYNYAIHHEQISETRSIIANLLSPLTPLYNEYKDIALYEKNPYLKSVRIFMPVFIVVAFTILVAIALAPLALPELVFAAVFIPSLFIGLAIANQYVSVKNEIYNTLREHYYGGPFEIPEYQVNPRMLRAFGNQENANKVRIFYIEALQRCDALENEFSSKHNQGILTPEDIEQRKEKMTKMHDLSRDLSLEWYDIHSNIDLSYQQASSIFLNRLQQTTDKEYQKLQKTVQEELDSISQSLTEVTTDIKITIDKYNKAPVLERGKEMEGTTIKAHYRHGLFKPLRCLNTRAYIEELDTFREQISCAATAD